MDAASRARSEMVRVLLHFRADPNAKGKEAYTPLMHAVWSHDLATVEAVLAAKPDINATNDKGETALSIAQGLNEAKIAQVLLRTQTDSR